MVDGVAHVAPPIALRAMKDAPRQGTIIVIVTPRDAHRAMWDSDYSNFWSLTAPRALNEGEACGWLTEDEWTAFSCARSAASEVFTEEASTP